MAKRTTRAAGQRDDQRGTPRRLADWGAEAPLGSEARRVQLMNISSAGLMFSTRAPARVPATMELRVELPDGEHLTLTSSVRHVARRAGGDRVDVGVQFSGIDAEKRRLLDSAIAALPPS
jgi:hypothetical protein